MTHLYKAAAGMDSLERLALGDSPVHRLHPLAKLITTIVFVGVVISFPSQSLAGQVPFLAYPLIMLPASGTPFKPLAGRFLCALPFSLMGAISNLILMRETVMYLGSFALSAGLVSFASIMLKTFLTVFAALLLAATTPFPDIGAQLAVLRVPKILCLQLVMTYRYIALLLSEASSMMRAYFLRSPRQKGIRMKDMGSFLGQLILRSIGRAGRVYHAMKCRGFDGTFRPQEAIVLQSGDLIYTAALVSGIVFLRFFNLSVFIGALAEGL